MAFSRSNPNGTVTESSVPFHEDKWWDSPATHCFWSYPQWFSLICQGYGWEAPHRAMKKWFAR